jgi:hypothetical protein
LPSFVKQNKVPVCRQVIETRRDALNIGLPTPVNRKGLRSVECPCYGECLMHAVRQNWKAWTCEECVNLGLDSIYQKFKSITPYYRLLSEIYPEFKRKYGPVMKSLHVGV